MHRALCWRRMEREGVLPSTPIGFVPVGAPQPTYAGDPFAGLANGTGVHAAAHGRRGQDRDSTGMAPGRAPGRDRGELHGRSDADGQGGRRRGGPRAGGVPAGVGRRLAASAYPVVVTMGAKKLLHGQVNLQARGPVIRAVKRYVRSGFATKLHPLKGSGSGHTAFHETSPAGEHVVVLCQMGLLRDAGPGGSA